MEMNTITSNQEEPSKKDTLLSATSQNIQSDYVLIDRIHKLPYTTFKDIICEGNLNLLLVTGSATQDKLDAAWTNILEEYGESMGQADKNDKLYFNIYREYLTLKRRQQKRLMYIDLLRKMYVKEWAIRLQNLLLVKLNLDPTNIELYNSTLDKYQERSIKCIQLSIKESELLTLEKQRQETGESALTRPDRSFFAKVEQNIEDSVGFYIPWNEITTLDYCERVVRYIQVIEERKKQKR
jgi:hypothetical protein